jgi:2-polyprenyl-3-methyl-5-hydroxy-6-metoxy-1,4-benzoquinol methylase
VVVSEGVRFWEKKYDGDELVYGSKPNKFLLRHGPHRISSGAKVLSLAEGEGRNAIWLARRGCYVTAVDWSSRALDKMTKLADKAGVSVEAHRQDVTRFDCGRGRWDVVLLLHLHLPPTSRRRLHMRVARSLRPGGLVFVEALHPAQRRRKGNGDLPRFFYTRQVLCQDFSSLAVELAREEERFVDAGEYSGMTSVTNLIGRKRTGKRK